MRTYLRALVYYRPFLWLCVWTGIASLAGIALSLLKPWPLKLIVDEVLPRSAGNGERTAAGDGFLPEGWIAVSNPASVILVLCLALVVIHVVAALIQQLCRYRFIEIGLRAVLHLRRELYERLQSLPLRFHGGRSSSDSAYRVTYDSQSIQTIFNQGLTNVFSSLVLLFGISAVMFTIDWRLTLLSLAVTPFLVLAMFLYAKRIRGRSKRVSECESDVLGTSEEGLGAVRLVQAYGREAREVERLDRNARASLYANIDLTRTQLASNFTVAVLMALATAVLLYFGALHVLHGQLQLGELLVFTAYLVMLFQPLEELTYTAWAMEGAAAGAERCFEILDSDDDLPDAPDARDPEPVCGEIVFEDVTFAYDEKGPVLKEVGFRIPAGRKVAIVGSSGSGKSTLLSLVPRFFDPDSGTVTLDGCDLRKLKKSGLRAAISLVLQDTILFTASVKENIAYGRPDATPEEIASAARRARADGFIGELPDGYNTILGDGGTRLSAGQAQRIAIARAFLKDAPVLILDEPASALDPETEGEVMAALDDLTSDRTTLLVSHRYRTIHGFDHILVLENGRIAEQGSGPDLLAKGGVYAGLHRAETGGGF